MTKNLLCRKGCRQHSLRSQVASQKHAQIVSCVNNKLKKLGRYLRWKLKGNLKLKQPKCIKLFRLVSFCWLVLIKFVRLLVKTIKQLNHYSEDTAECSTNSILVWSQFFLAEVFDVRTATQISSMIRA